MKVRSSRRSRLDRSFVAHLLTTGSALFIVCVLLLVLQFVSLRRSLIDDLSTQARIVGANSTAALIFNDAQAGGETIDALSAVPYVRAAALFTKDGQALARYPASRIGPAAPSAEMKAGGTRVGLADVEIVQAIAQNGLPAGHIAIVASLTPLYWRLAIYAVLMVAVACVALTLTLPLMLRMKRAMSDAEAHLQRLAHIDPITELPNRHAFNHRLRMALEKVKLRGGGVGLALLDLDNFKVVNDTLGHDHGDQLLKALGDRLLESARASDMVCRIGGDEFAIIMRAMAQPEQAEAAAQRILGLLARPLTVRGQDIYVTASIGTAWCPTDGADLETLMRNADTAMYHAKHGGKNASASFRPEMNLRLQHRVALEADLHRALDRGELRLHYQPQISLHDSRVVGVEALLRWEHPTRGMVSPVEFIPVAEECGLIEPIGRWVMRTACLQAAQWRDAGLGLLQMSVNVSPRQFRARLIEDVLGALRDSGLEAHQLELEITESLLMESVTESIALLQRLRNEGVRLSIDDFGTGHSSLSYLPALPVNRLKIDRSFVRAIPGDGATLTSAILALARSFNLSVVAEGVEHLEQIEFLRRAGCQIVQGWFFAPALKPDELAAFVEKHNRPTLQSSILVNAANA